jgi:hypothetical protein
MVFLRNFGTLPYKFWTETNREAKAAGLDEITTVTVVMARNT